jgi:AcrR family transcriptional regulator
MNAPVARRAIQRRPRDERIADILAAAAREFGDKGYEGAVVSSIAEAAGLSEASIFKFFDSKRALVSAVMETWYSRLIADIERSLAGIAEPSAQLRFLIHRHLLAVKDDPGLCRLVFRELRAGEAYHGSELHALNRRYTAFVVNAVREGQERGVFRADIAPALARDMIFGGLEHHVWDFLGGRRALDIAAEADAVAAFALSALDQAEGHETLSGAIERLDRIAARLEAAERGGQ